MTKCKNCGKEYRPKRSSSKYCSDRCKKQYQRSLAGQEVKVSGTKDLTAQDLYDAIDTYPEDTWKDSEEYKELERRIKAKSVKTLQEEGYWIPNWKAKSQSKPK